MLITAIVGQNDKEKTANIINSILHNSKKRISIVDSKNLSGLDEKRIKGYLAELERNKTDILILKLDLSEVSKEIYDYLRFDIIVFTDKADEINGEMEQNYMDLMKKAFSLLKEKGIAIVNADDNELNKFFKDIKHYIVTYGFNLKASMTTSSIGDLVAKDNMLCCLQRRIYTKNGTVIEPQEFKVRTDLESVDPSNVLAAATFVLVNGFDINQMKN
ncbi:MAG TPA: Mur ligase family protein [Acetivibrio sp.]|uniref:Mur ligase family protein n=1 Tax=Acetivibrio sp. TaxID=1872092 RepID=UPI002C4B5420|nr:Mur ligase family protein [Acetivibrio sp.]HOM01714.1 Mur ligase family protein [Acetivibrio sp.]